ncbi:MAG TPA: hypothetical protein VFV34_20655 [Blastocatellia bacterium]|nr:hypothetical protein [Blastocatellia bacterium]
MPQKRKWMIGGSFALACWCTLGMIAMFAWFASGVTQEQAEAGGVVVFIFVFIPALAGSAIGFGAMDKRLGNPTSVWVAAVWNTLISAVFVALIVVGLLAKA